MTYYADEPEENQVTKIVVAFRCPNSHGWVRQYTVMRDGSIDIQFDPCSICKQRPAICSTFKDKKILSTFTVDYSRMSQEN